MSTPADRAARLYRRVGSQLVRRTLRRSFRRVAWVGPLPDLPADRPVVIYANHHHFYDGHLLWYFIESTLDRRGMTWMEDWDAFPFFGPLGAEPFPADDPRRRAATVRRTVERMRAEPRTMLFLFPEGRLHAPEEGILPFPEESFARFDRILPDEKFWWPVATHVTWRGESLPTALLSGGQPHTRADGDEADRLRACWTALRERAVEPSLTVLDGRKSPQESWNFGFLRGLFSRFR